LPLSHGNDLPRQRRLRPAIHDENLATANRARQICPDEMINPNMRNDFAGRCAEITLQACFLNIFS
jgi:hypothetical protein